MLIKDVAICIRAIDYSETSQIVTFFARMTGKVSAIVKGAKRLKSAFDGPVEVFSTGRIVFSQKGEENLATLTEFEQQPHFRQLTNNLLAMNCSLFGAELVNSLTDEFDPHPELFDRFFQFLHNISEIQSAGDRSQATIALLILFQLALLKETGLQPILDYCVNCKTKYGMRTNKSESYFSSAANGLICRDCEISFPDRIRITEQTACCLNNINLMAAADKKTFNDIEQLLVYHFAEILHHTPRMAKYIIDRS